MVEVTDEICMVTDSGLVRGQGPLDPWQKVEGSKSEVRSQSHGGLHIHGPGHDEALALVGI